MVSCVGGRCSGSRGTQQGGLSMSGASTLMSVCSWAGMAGLCGSRWSSGCPGCLWRGGLVVAVFRGALDVSWKPVDEDGEGVQGIQ